MKALLILCLLNISVAAAKIKIAVPEFYGFSQKESSGYFNELMDQMKKRGVKDFELRYLPLKRANQEFYAKKHDCVLGGDENTYRFYNYDHSNWLFSAPYHMFTMRVFTPKDAPQICHKKGLEGKSLIVIDSFPVEKFLDGVRVSRVEVAPSQTQAIKMLVNARAEALVGYYPSQEKELEQLAFCPDLVLQEFNSKIHCHQSKGSRAFIENFNQTLAAMNEDQALLKLYTKYHGEKEAKAFCERLQKESPSQGGAKSN